MKKIILSSLLAVVFVAGLSWAYIGAENASQNQKNLEFLKKYGWETEGQYIEKVDIEIPHEFDQVYENYNFLQKDAGLDLTPYRGMKAVRYTYLVKNFPDEVGEPIRANVLCVKGTPVAGDLMTVSLGGFMLSLNFNASECLMPIAGSGWEAYV